MNMPFLRQCGKVLFEQQYNKAPVSVEFVEENSNTREAAHLKAI